MKRTHPDRDEGSKPPASDPVAEPEVLKEEGEQGVAKEGAQGAVTLPRKELEALKEKAAKAEEHWDRFLRQQADFDNIRKRLERERIDFQRYAHEDIIADLLGILDDLERSVTAAQDKQENFGAFLKGIEMILAHLYELLKKRGVTPIEAQGRPFDPNQHEALLQTETGEHEDGTVLEELQKGYRLHDRVLRTAKVRVAKKIEDVNQ